MSTLKHRGSAGRGALVCLILGFVFAFSRTLPAQPTAGPSTPEGVDAAHCRFVGVEYEVWFPGIPPQGKYRGEQYWEPRWGTPLLGTYDSANPKIIDQHAAWIAQMGVDFVLIDWANNIANELSGSSIVGHTIRSKTDSVFAEYRHLKRQNRPHPKIAILLGAQNQNGIRAQKAISSGALSQEADYVYNHFVKVYPDLYFEYLGKPLLVVYIGVPAAFKRPPDWSDHRFTLRWMSGFLESQPSLYGDRPSYNQFWSWIDRVPIPAHANGRVDAVTVTQAYPGPKSWLDSAHWPLARGRVGKDGLSTFNLQWRAAVSYNPQIILLNQWNEFAVHDRSGPATGDEYTVRLSNDLEPTQELRCAPIQAVHAAVGEWKRTKLPTIDCGVP